MSANANANANAKPEAVAPAAKKLPLKTILILAGVFVVEAAIIAGAFMFGSGPTTVQGDPGQPDPRVLMDQPEELRLIEGRYENNKWGRSYQFDLKIFVLAKKKNIEPTKSKIEGMQAQLQSDIRTIIAQAEPAQLMEPTKKSIIRQIHQEMEKRLGVDADGAPIVIDVMIPHWVRYKTDL